MNIFSQEKYHFIAVLIAIFTTTQVLQAAPEASKAHSKAFDQKRVTFATLELDVPRLERLSIEIADPNTKKAVHSILKHATAVLKAGPKAKPEAVKKALNAVQKATSKIKQKKSHHKSSSSDSSSSSTSSTSSSSSSSSCDICSDLSELKSDVSGCCKDVTSGLVNILSVLEADFPCSAPIAISSVPIVIRTSGKYCVTTNLVYNGAGAAITVAANNVSINFHNHSLTINDSTAVGVLAQDVSEFTLENDIIQGSSIFKTPTSAAVSLIDVQKATLKNIYTFNTTKGVHILNSNDVLVQNSLLNTHEGTSVPTAASIGAGILIDGSTSVVVDSCTFAGAGLAPGNNEASNAILVQGASSAVMVKTSSFNNWMSTFTINEVTGMQIQDCLAVASPVSNSNLLQLGTATTAANDITIQNSSFIQNTAVPGFDGLLFLNGSGCLLQNVIVDVTTVNDGNVNPYFPGAIHVGCAVNGHVVCTPILAFSDIVADSCIVKGENQYGLFIENGSYIAFTNSQFTDASLANVFFDGAVDPTFHQSIFGAEGCIIQDSTITNAAGTGTGILINPGANTNAIITCDISNNAQNGIVIAQYAQKNQINGNSVHANGNFGIESSEPTTALFFNTSCKNTSTNCIGVSPSQLPGASPAVAGSNICCTP